MFVRAVKVRSSRADRDCVNVIIEVVEALVESRISADERAGTACDILTDAFGERRKFAVAVNLVRFGLPAEPLDGRRMVGEPIVVGGGFGDRLFDLRPNLGPTLSGRPTDPPSRTAREGSVDGQSPALDRPNVEVRDVPLQARIRPVGRLVVDSRFPFGVELF